ADDHRVRALVRVSRHPGVPVAGARDLDCAAPEVASVGDPGDRHLRSRDHAEPGSLLVVRHGRTHVHLLRDLHHHREVLEAMSPSRATRATTTKRAPSRAPRDRRELWTAIAVASLIVVATFALVWFLRPNRESTSTTDTTTTTSAPTTSSTTAP